MPGTDSVLPISLDSERVMAAKYELRSFSDPGSSENMGLKESGGCYIKTATGIVIFLLLMFYIVVSVLFCFFNYTCVCFRLYVVFLCD